MKMLTVKRFKINILLLFVCAFMLMNATYAASSNNATLEQISKMENSIFGFDYKKDDTNKRISRIENNVFGKTNANLSANERIKKLNEALGIENYEDSKKKAYEIDKSEVKDINYPQIDVLEQQMFNTTYEKENIYKRLERLEKKIFGSSQDGDLMSRTDRLNAYIRKDAVAQNPNTYTQQPYSTTKNIGEYMGSQNKYENTDAFIQLAGLETVIFSKTYSQDPVGLRLNRLERKIFQRDFSSDDDYLRLQRLQAAANAKQTAKLYEANKIQKYTSTGMQIGSIILMILALIL